MSTLRFPWSYAHRLGFIAIMVGVASLVIGPAQAVSCQPGMLDTDPNADFVTSVVELRAVATGPGAFGRVTALAVTRYWGGEPELGMRTVGSHMPHFPFCQPQPGPGEGDIVAIALGSVKVRDRLEMLRTDSRYLQEYEAALTKRFGPPTRVEIRLQDRVRGFVFVTWVYWITAAIPIMFITLIVIRVRQGPRSSNAPPEPPPGVGDVI